MPYYRIWVFPAKQLGLLDFEHGHAEIEVNETLFSLLPNEKADQVSPLDTPEHSVISLGSISPISQIQFGRRHNYLRTLFVPDSPPIKAKVFGNTIQAKELKKLNSHLIDSSKAPPNYCPRSLDGTKNCITFVVDVLKIIGLWPEQCKLNRRYHLPSVFLEDMERFYKEGFFIYHNEKVFKDDQWITLSSS